MYGEWMLWLHEKNLGQKSYFYSLFTLFQFFVCFRLMFQSQNDTFSLQFLHWSWIAGRVKDLSLCHHVHTSSGTHPASSPVASFPKGKVSGV
jgi:hypothetical protein